MTVGENGHDNLDVVLVSQPASAGVAVCVRDLAAAAVEAGHRVTVICPDHDRGPLAAWIDGIGAGRKPLDMKRGPAFRDIRDAWSIRRLAKHADILHLHSSKAGALGRAPFVLWRGQRPAIVFTPHAWSWSVGGKLAPVYRLIERLLGRRADAIVAVSEAEAEQGRAAIGTAARNISVILNGVDRERFSPDGPTTDRDASTPLIVCVGRLCEQKGQDIAIRALGLVNDGSARLRLVGDGPDRDALAVLAEEAGVADRIEWQGEVTDTAPELRGADVVVAPSRWEGMSLVFLEAMAAGAALIVSDVPGSEIVDNGGMVVAREDERALASAIDSLLGDDSLRQQLGAAARERSRSYDLTETLDRNLALWSTLADRPFRRRSLSSHLGHDDGEQ